MQIYDPVERSWVVAQPTAHPRVVPELTWMGCGAVLITDGDQWGYDFYTFTHEYFDLVTRQWVELPATLGGSPGWKPQPLRDGGVLLARPMLTLGP